MLSWIFLALRLGGVLASPQTTPSGLQMTPPSLPGTENPRKHGSPDFILILHTLPLFYPSSCTPSPYSIPAYTHPSPYSIPPHTCPPLMLSHCMHVLSCSLPAHTCHPSILFQLMHALLTPCHMNLEGMFLL